MSMSTEAFMTKMHKNVQSKKELWSVFEFHKTVGWRRAAQGVWFYGKDDSESQLKVLQNTYPWKTFTLRSSKECEIKVDL